MRKDQKIALASAFRGGFVPPSSVFGFEIYGYLDLSVIRVKSQSIRLFGSWAPQNEVRTRVKGGRYRVGI